ncbi:zinc ribbon domain-containing protein [Nonomuraea sp. NPDC049419]|uniref:zinc ribbon domain-containing protein n=1 Tax=Nonomuraea sp. NPDC049419 TaxID=3155772 RepID=UPI0034301F24
MPVGVVKTATGRYLVLEQPAGRGGRAVACCRVSSAGQKADLERQAGRVVTPQAVTLADRVWTCGCGREHDRDVNAARNLLNAMTLEQEAAWFHVAGQFPGDAERLWRRCKTRLRPGRCQRIRQENH